MKINKIKIHNYRGLRDLSIEINGSSAIVFGINGSGKTSILKSIGIILSQVFKDASNDRQIKVVDINKEDVYIGADETKLELEIEEDGEVYNVFRKRNSTEVLKSRSIAKISGKLRSYIGTIVRNGVNEQIEFNSESIPIYVFYGINRVNRTPVSIRREYRGVNKLDAWRDTINEGSINQDDFFEWLRGRQEKENYIIVKENSSYVDEQLRDVKTAILSALGKSFTDIMYRIGDAPGVCLIKNDQMISVSQLSDGEIEIVTMVGDIARRLSIANPNSDAPFMGQGVVLIDEIDLHLHPEWQEHIFGILADTFPNIQFIATTHSPKILNSLQDEVKVISLYPDEGEVKSEVIEPLNMWDANSVLYRFMDVHESSEKARIMIMELRDALDHKDYTRASALADDLERRTAGDNIEVVRARTLIGLRK